jgi:hypothetical protein
MRIALTAVLFALAWMPALAQSRQRGGVYAPPLRGFYVTFHGKLKDLNKKSIILEEDSGKIMTFRRDKKTKFAEGNALIKDSDIDLESLVTVYATEDNDLKLIAAGILVDSNQKKRGPSSR